VTDHRVGDPRTGYTLGVGPPSQDRDWIEATLLWGHLEVYVGSEGEVLATPDLVPPVLVILDDSGRADARRASQRHLAAHPALQGVPLLILSYEADIDSFSDAIAKGAAAYLVKPVNPEELVAVAQKLSGWTGISDHSEKRRRLRRPLLLRVDIDIRARKLRVPGHLIDASGSGCRIELDQPLSPGDLVRVVLHGHRGSTHVALGAETRWHRVAPDGRHVAGLRFTGTTALMAGKLLGFATSDLA
jgi:CheY-like chemotaxis protein